MVPALPQDMGRSFGPLTEREVHWLSDKEWARGADDILWRRSKLWPAPHAAGAG